MKASKKSPNDESQPSTSGIVRGSKMRSTKPVRHLANSKSNSKVDMYCCEQFSDSKSREKWIKCKARAHEAQSSYDVCL